MKYLLTTLALAVLCIAVWTPVILVTFHIVEPAPHNPEQFVPTKLQLNTTGERVSGSDLQPAMTAEEL